MTLTAEFADTISASGVLCDTQDCFFDEAARGNSVFGPYRNMHIPDVDL